MSKSATISMVVAAVVVIAAAAALVFVRIPTSTSGQALPGESAARTTSAKPNDPLQPKATGGPQVAGWQPIPISNGGALDTDKAYDVPQGWSPIGGGLANFGDHNEVSLVAPAIYKQGYCPADPKSWRSMAGLAVLPNKGNIEVGAAAAAQLIANTVFTTQERVQPETKISDPQPVTVYRNKKAVVVTAKLAIPVTEKDKCTSPSVTIAVMMMENSKPEDVENVTLVAMGDQNVPEATPEEDLTRIVTSLHLIT